MTDRTCTLETDALRLVVSERGAEMQSLRNAAGDELLWHGDPTHWSGRAPVLFPIVGRAVDDRVASGGINAEMKQHGFARRRIFAPVASDAASCTHLLRADDATRAVYPFDFALRVTHALDGATLKVDVDVTNEGEAPMPFGFGFHPAFRWPLPGAEGEVHRVSLAPGITPRRQPLRADGLLQPHRVPGPFSDGVVEITDGLFSDGALVFPDLFSGLFSGLISDPPPGGSSDPGPSGAASLRYGPQTGPALSFTFSNLPDFALWRPLGAPFVCIEPWHGTASVVGDGPEIAQRPNSLCLTPGETARFGYTVTVHS